MKNLVAAMTKKGVKRLINLSAMGAGENRDECPWMMKLFFRPLLLKNVFFEDKERGEVHLLSSSLDYTNVCPGRLTNLPARGGVKASLKLKGLKPVMSREDLALFMISQLKNPEWVRKSPLIGY